MPHRRHGAGREPPVQDWANGLIARTLGPTGCLASAGADPGLADMRLPARARPVDPSGGLVPVDREGECFSKHALRGSGGPALGGLLLLGGHRGHVLRWGMRPGFV